MTVTYFGAASNPADNAALFDTSSPIAITPPGSMVAGDLVVVFVGEYDGGGGLTHAVSVTGGQTWNALSAHTDGTVGAFRGFWCQYNGTWAANPSFSTTRNTDFNDFSAVMVVFRPTSGSATWSVDVAESAATYSAPGGSFDVTTTGQTATGTSGVHVALWYSGTTTITWALQTGGWSNPGGTTQWRNSGNGQLTLSIAYKVFTSAGASGNVTNRQSASKAGWQSIITFKETVPGSAAPFTGKLGRLFIGKL